MSTIKLSEYKGDHAWHNGHVIATSDIPSYVKTGSEGKGFFAVTEDCITSIARCFDADSYIESVLDHVAGEIEGGEDYVNWTESKEAAEAELQTLLDAWRAKHIAPNHIYWETSTRIDVSELTSSDPCCLDEVLSDFERASQEFDARVLQRFVEKYPQHADALRRYAHIQLTFVLATVEEIEREP